MAEENEKNVRCLLEMLEPALKSATNPDLFKPSEEITQQLLEKYLNPLREAQSIDTYKVVCDQKQNADWTKQKLIVDISASRESPLGQHWLAEVAAGRGYLDNENRYHPLLAEIGDKTIEEHLESLKKQHFILDWKVEHTENTIAVTVCPRPPGWIVLEYIIPKKAGSLSPTSEPA